MDIICKFCGSENVYFSKKKQVYVCEDCERTFVPEKEFVPRKVFLSYGHDRNAEIVDIIYKKLKERGHDPWIDNEEIKAGDDWRESITKGILQSNGFLAFISNYSVRVPGVCLDEISIGVSNYNCRIQSVLLEKGVAAPNCISNIQWLDMSDWKEVKDSGDEKLWNKWLGDRIDQLIKIIEDPKYTILSGNISELQDKLAPLSPSLKMRQILRNKLILRDWITDKAGKFVNEGKSPALFVYGSPGTGKSVLSAYLSNFSTACVAAHFCEFNNAQSLDPDSFIRSIIFQIACSIEDYQMRLVELIRGRSLSEMTAEEKLYSLLLEPLNMLIDGERDRKVIIVDALDEASENNKEFEDLLLKMAEGLPGWIKLIVTSRPENPIKWKFQKFEHFSIDDHKDEVRGDIEKYVLQEVSDRKTADRIIDLSKGSFLYASELIKLVSETGNLLSINTITPGLGGAYFVSFKRKFRKHDVYEAKYRPLFEVLFAAKEQLTTEEIADILSLEPDEIHKRLWNISSYVTEFSSGQSNTVHITHKSVLEWLTSESAGEFVINKDRGNKWFADYILRTVSEDKEPTEYQAKYALAHLSMTTWEELDHAQQTKLLGKLFYAAQKFGLLEMERAYLTRIEESFGREEMYFYYALEHYKKVSGEKSYELAKDALAYVEKNELGEKERFSLVCQIAFSYFYAGHAEEAYELILKEKSVYSDEFWQDPTNEAHFWHVISVCAHDLDSNGNVVNAADRSVKLYRANKKYYDRYIAMVNLFDGYMALGQLAKAEKVAARVFEATENRYFIHVDDILQICYANLLQTEGRIMESLLYYENGLKLAKEIQNWDYLYGSIWRELAVAKFGDHSCVAALQKYREKSRESGYNYLVSLADCFMMLAGHYLGIDICKVLGGNSLGEVVPKATGSCENVAGEVTKDATGSCENVDEEFAKDATGSEALVREIIEIGMPGHILQACAVLLLDGADPGIVSGSDSATDPNAEPATVSEDDAVACDKEAWDLFFAQLAKCEGVKGDPTIIHEVYERYQDTLAEEQREALAGWCKKFARPITDYQERIRKQNYAGLDDEPILVNYSCIGCQSKCCYDGVYVTEKEEQQIHDFVAEYPERFAWLQSPYIVNGDWPGMRSLRKTEKVPFDGYDETFPAHFTRTKCIFELESGECSLQRVATDMQLHPWKVKPRACWSFPIRGVAGDTILPPETDREHDSDYVDENYPGYATYMPCAAKCDQNNGKVWYEQFRHEIEFYRYLMRNGLL